MLKKVEANRTVLETHSRPGPEPATSQVLDKQIQTSGCYSLQKFKLAMDRVPQWRHVVPVLHSKNVCGIKDGLQDDCSSPGVATHSLTRSTAAVFLWPL